MKTISTFLLLTLHHHQAQHIRALAVQFSGTDQHLTIIRAPSTEPSILPHPKRQKSSLIRPHTAKRLLLPDPFRFTTTNRPPHLIPDSQPSSHCPFADHTSPPPERHHNPTLPIWIVLLPVNFVILFYRGRILLFFPQTYIYNQRILGDSAPPHTL